MCGFGFGRMVMMELLLGRHCFASIPMERPDGCGSVLEWVAGCRTEE